MTTPALASYPLYQIYVGDLSIITQKETLFSHFSKYGNIIDLKLGTNKFKKFGFVSFDHPDSGLLTKNIKKYYRK